jgi:hypothetical protein
MGTSVLIPGWIEKELRANFARACRAGRRAAKTEPRAAFAEYRSQERALRIKLTNGATITLPVELISGLKGARPKDLRGVEVLGLQHAKTGARAAVRAPDRGRIPWNLDVSPFRYYFMTTWTIESS